MNGQPLRVDRRAAGARARRSPSSSDVNTAATVHHRNIGAFFWIAGARRRRRVVVLGMLVLGGLRGRRRPRPSAAGRAGCCGVLALVGGRRCRSPPTWPGSSRGSATGAPVPALVAAVVAADLRRRGGRPAGPVAARTGSARRWPSSRVTLGTLLVDVLTGSTLELNGLLGYDAIVAGRFTGYGNLSFGLLSVSALLRHRGRGDRASAAGPARSGPARSPAAPCSASGCSTVAVIGAPGAGPRLRRRPRGAAGLPAARDAAGPRPGDRRPARRDPRPPPCVAVGAVAVLDWLRPAADRSHLGRFVEQVLTGEAWTVISRKGAGQPRHPAAAARWPGCCRSRSSPPSGWSARAACCAAARDEVGGPAGLPPPTSFVAARRRCWPALLSLALGAAVNDSGVALPADRRGAAGAAAGLAGRRRPAAGAPVRGRRRVALPTPARSRAPERVTVVSRGSTVWNA